MTLKVNLLLIIKIFIGILFVGGAIFNLYELDFSAHPEMVNGTILAILISFSIGGFLLWSSFKDLKNSKNVLKNVASNIGSNPRIIFLAIVTLFIVLGLFIPGGALTSKYEMICESYKERKTFVRLYVSPLKTEFSLRHEGEWIVVDNQRAKKNDGWIKDKSVLIKSRDDSEGVDMLWDFLTLQYTNSNLKYDLKLREWKLKKEKIFPCVKSDFG